MSLDDPPPGHRIEITRNESGKYDWSCICGVGRKNNADDGAAQRSASHHFKLIRVGRRQRPPRP